MKKVKPLLIASIVLLASCSNPYLNPTTSKALSEERQVELLQSQDTLIREQNKQLKRIADALERMATMPK